MSTWDTSSIDTLEGKIFVITEGTSGLGLQTGLVLLRQGAQVIFGAQHERKANDVRGWLRKKGVGAKAQVKVLDLGSQRSIFRFAQELSHEYPRIDVLINNAGLSTTPGRLESADGHELFFSVNYLGHFVLTAQLFPLLLRSSDPRIVSVSSLLHHHGDLHLEDLELHQGYSEERAYAQSKLALLVFAKELARRCRIQGITVKSVPVHPGLLRSGVLGLGQSVGNGALPVLFAATSLEARNGVYYGPDGFREYWGHPMEAKVAPKADNLMVAKKLWAESERLSGVHFDVESSRSIGLH